MASSKWEKKKKELAQKSMPDPEVKKNVTKADKEAAMPCKSCGSKSHKTADCK